MDDQNMKSKNRAVMMLKPGSIESVARRYDEIARKYMDAQDRFYSGREDGSRTALYAQFDFLKKGMKVLDAGCGFGKDMAYFHGLGADVYGVDASAEMVKLAKERYPELTNLFVRDLRRTGFENGFFDAVYSRYALHYSENFEEALSELHRVLRPGGHLIFLVAHPLLGFIAKEERNYHKRGIVTISIYGNAISIEEPTNTFQDYLCPFLLGNFDLVGFYENPGMDNETGEPCQVVPDYLIINCRKRRP